MVLIIVREVFKTVLNKINRTVNEVFSLRHFRNRLQSFAGICALMMLKKHSTRTTSVRLYYSMVS